LFPEANKQIIPPTKNDPSPPSIEPRKVVDLSSLSEAERDPYSGGRRLRYVDDTVVVAPPEGALAIPLPPALVDIVWECVRTNWW
jgi:hypothetical protein